VSPSWLGTATTPKPGVEVDNVAARHRQVILGMGQRAQMDGMGKFAWILDPDGTKIEFWQPEPEPPSRGLPALRTRRLATEGSTRSATVLTI